MTQTYTVLARKYRPQSFKDMIGQDVLVQTLKNAFESDRVAHAYILTGVRGVGKTTTARILAKCLNCETGQTINPCGECSHCTSITDGSHMDVIEMDGASNRGIDDVRIINDNVKYKPASARYKIFIIDEVHMLTTEAFNALLKTLEEPPSHVKFIFATTDIEKVPVTILSRCQKFYLKRIDIETLTKHFTSICSKENVTYDQDALPIIADHASGSVRDGLSILDQAIVLGNGHVKTDVIRDMLGVLNWIDILKLYQSVISGNGSDTFKIIESHYHSGGQLMPLLASCLDVTYALKTHEYGGGKNIISQFSDEDKAVFERISQSTKPSQILRMWQLLTQGVQELKRSDHQYATIQMIFSKMALISGLPSPEDLMSSNAKVPQSVKKNCKITNFESLTYQLRENGHVIMAIQLAQDVRLVSFCEGKIELSPCRELPINFKKDLDQFITSITGKPWEILISESNNVQNKTLHEKEQIKHQELLTKINDHPLISNVLEKFGQSEIIIKKQ